MTSPASSRTLPAAPQPRMPPRTSWAWLGVVPFFLFALMFLILPTAYLVVGAFQDAEGHFTLRNIANLFQPTILNAYWISIKISTVSAETGDSSGTTTALVAVGLLSLIGAGGVFGVRRRQAAVAGRSRA